MATDNSNKDKTLQQAFARIEHQFGRGSIMRLGTIIQVATYRKRTKFWVIWHRIVSKMIGFPP